jgi:N-methylhydantoinase B
MLDLINLLRFELIRDSGGAGRFRGGLGIRREYLNLEDARFSIRSMKHLIPPNGCAGGGTGRPGDIWINPDSAQAKRLPTRYADYPLRKGDVFRLDAGRRRSWRSLERAARARARRHPQRFVSPAAAERLYGVVLKQERDAWTVDQAATLERRKQMKASEVRG